MKKLGISLVALIITIIVLIILTGTVILIGINAPGQAQLSIFDSNMATVQDAVMLKMSDNMMKYASEDTVVIENAKWDGILQGYTQQGNEWLKPDFDMGGIKIEGNNALPLDVSLSETLSISAEEIAKYYITKDGFVYYYNNGVGFLAQDGKSYYAKGIEKKVISTYEKIADNIYNENGLRSIADGCWNWSTKLRIEYLASIYQEESVNEAVPKVNNMPILDYASVNGKTGADSTATGIYAILTTANNIGIYLNIVEEEGEYYIEIPGIGDTVNTIAGETYLIGSGDKIQIVFTGKMLGDVDGSGEITTTDITFVIYEINSSGYILPSNLIYADINFNNVLEEADYNFMHSFWCEDPVTDEDVFGVQE